MATTSIWSVKGWLGKLVVYVENPEKTENPQYFKKEDMTERQVQSLSDVIDYVADTVKTEKMDDETCEILQNFVSCVNCAPATAREEMLAVKSRFGKTEGVVAYHGYQSFAPGEATPELAHQIGMELAKTLWGEQFQVLVTTHLDKENHLHNHFVVNNVSFLDGHKYYRSEKDYYEMRKESDRLCREYRLSVIENPKPGKSKHYGEWRAEQEQRPTWRGIVKTDVDTALRASMTERQFFDALKKRGYEIKVGKDISVRPPGKPRFVRLARNFGEGYTLEAIRKKILAQTRPKRQLPEPEKKVKTIRIRGSTKTARKITGFRALYFHYCYKLGIFPKGRPQSKKRIHFLFREDLRKLNAISQEVRLLCRNRIDTAEQLSSYQSGLNTEIITLAGQRKELYKQSRTKAVKTDEGKLTEVKREISVLSKQLGSLRREVRLCEDITMRSGVIKEKIKTVREDEKCREKAPAGKEKQHESFR